MKRIFTVWIALIMVVMMSTAAYAESVTQQGAVDKALKDAGLASDKITGLETEKENGKFEIEFKDAGKGTEYNYEISASTGKILEKSVEYVYSRTNSKKKIGVKAARKKAAKLTGIKYKTVKKGSCKYKYKKKFGKYELKFRSGGYRYEVEIAAASGDIIEYEKEAIKKK